MSGVLVSHGMNATPLLLLGCIRAPPSSIEAELRHPAALFGNLAISYESRGP
jgi:hypothetical protein